MRRALSIAVDREIGKAFVALDILSRSPLLADDNLETFHTRAQHLINWPNTWVALYTLEGGQLLTTAAPYGSLAIGSSRADELRQIAISRKPEISGVFKGSRTGRYMISLRMPVIREGQAQYILTMGLGVEALQSLVSDLRLPSSWLVTLADRDGKVIARSQDADRFVGQPLSTKFQDAIRESTEGTFPSVSLSQVPIIVTYSRSAEYGLAAAVSYPEAEFEASIYPSLGWGVALLVVALAGVFLALVLVRDILRPIQGLISSARLIGDGKVFAPRQTGIPEIDEVENALAAASQERDEASARMRESELRLSLAIEAGELGAWEYDPASGIFTTSAQCKAKFGRRPDEAFTYLDLLAAIHPDDRERQAYAVAEAIAQKTSFQVSYRVIWPDGSLRWVEVRGRPVDTNGSSRLIGVSQDVTNSKTAEARQELLFGELNHRVKNTLATVQSIAVLTRRSSTDTGTAWDTFDHRIRGMSKTHDLLTASKWEGAFLKDILEGELNFYQDSLGKRVQLRGKSVRVGPKATLALGLAVHELATNAAKYGGLSMPHGRLHVRWSIISIGDLPHLLIEWVESGGPPVRPPDRQGFGSRLLQRSLGLELGGDLKLNYEPSGVRCVITFPLHEVDESTKTQSAETTNVLPLRR
jgi:PAS domain S-box-containing protein